SPAKAKTERDPRLNREIKRALVLAGQARLFAPHRRAEDRLKQVLLKPRDDRIGLDQVQDWAVTLEDVRPTFFVAAAKLRHVTFLIAQLRECRRALRDGRAFYLRL